MHRRWTALLALGLGLTTGCADAGDREVEQTAAAFGGALRSGDVAAACDALAPLTRDELESSAQQPCAQALPALSPLRPDGVRSLDHFGRQARVVVTDGTGAQDTWFLSRVDDRWLVVAAGCEPRHGGLPYACDLEGP